MKIAHFADVHIHNLERHDVYRIQFKKIYDELNNLKPDRILISGDLFENFVSITNEAKVLAGEFLTNLAKITKVVITIGNHDLMKKNANRINSVKTVIELLNNSNILYLENSGFFEDDNIIWVNYSHLDKHKDIDPWDNENIEIPNNVNEKPTIALFHDPVYESTTYTGASFKNKKYKPISYFKNDDAVMLGDIHKLQYFRENKSAAYCSSTIQQNFGESPDQHGFILWDIKSKTDITSKYYDIPNEYNYINLYTHKNYNYENIDLNDDNITEKSKIKIHWIDYTNNINYDNEIKLRKYIKDKFNIDDVSIEKKGIHTDINGLEILNEKIDVLDKNNQKEIFIEYLKANNYDQELIDKILLIDDDIDSKLDIVDNNSILWSIESFYIDNFKSYDKVDVKWDKLNGVWQINGMNKKGKSTILDALTYILYGTTISTQKRQKHGDNRYINNKRNLDYCEGGTVININGLKYLIIRRTERKWNRKKTTLSSCSTTLDYYKGTKKIENNKLTDEEKKDTDKIITSAIGTFDDFVRLSLTTADNLNDLLSIDRSDFIDNISKDAGFDIFSYKEKEFKDYKKEKTKDFININTDEKELEIEKNKQSIELKKDELKIINNDIININQDKNNLQDKKENIIRKLHPIDKDIEKLNIEELDNFIKTEEVNISSNEELILELKDIEKTIKDYDITILNNKINEKNTIKESISSYNSEISNLRLINSENTNKIDSIGSDIHSKKETFKNDIKLTIKDIENDITNAKKDFVSLVNDKMIYFKDLLNDNKSKKSEINNNINNLMNDGKKLKIKNDELENSKVCPTCERLLEDKSLIAITEKININKQEMNNIKEKVTELKPSYTELENIIKDVSNKLELLSNKDYSFDEELTSRYNETTKKISELKIDKENKENLLSNIDNEIPEKLKIEFDVLNDRINELIKINSINNTKIDNIEYKIKECQNNILNLDIEIEKLNNEKEEVDKKKEKINNIPKIELNIEKSKNKINEFNNLKNKRIELDKKIIENKEIQKQIDNISNDIKIIDDKLNEKNDEKSLINSNIVMLEDRNANISKEIEKFADQKKTEEILNLYGKCVHRDGLPTYLLKKSIGVINQELNNLLTLVDFTVYFDDDLQLKMSNDSRLDVSQGAIESSGMERTFIACALKIALRKINNKSKPNLLIFDEITGKLDSDSVMLFNLLIENIKKEVDKLIIIEHQNHINYDVLIDVKKDNKGISSLDIIY